MTVNWRLQGNLKQLTSDIKVWRPGTTVYSVGDASHQSRSSDHNPYNWGYGVVVSAIDVMVGPHFTAADGAKLVLALKGRSDIQYIIYRGVIYNRSVGNWVGRKYYGADQHYNHVHVSATHSSAADKTTTRLSLLSLGQVLGSVGSKAGTSKPIVVATVKTPKFPGTVLNKGDKGPSVKVLQLRLNARGYHPLLKVDSDFGPSVEANVKAFQKFAKITVDGKVGAVTWSKLWSLKIT